jgi:hypothetical protein
MSAVRIALPRRHRGRPTPAARLAYEAEVAAFCAALLEFGSRVDFRVSARGWCYLLEGDGLAKGDFDAGEALINDCRKSGAIPIDFCADDDSRAADGVELIIDFADPTDEAAWIVDQAFAAFEDYTPTSFWEPWDYYIEAAVEKVDLKGLFGPVCEPFRIPITNFKGWADLNSRVAMIRRFAHWAERGKQGVLLYCGDFDPKGLEMSAFLRSNLNDLVKAAGVEGRWSADQLIIDRFGLNLDFIEAQRLTWIDGLITGSDNDLADPDHRHHGRAYVQDYLRKYCTDPITGIVTPRKCEANAILKVMPAGRELCRQAILKYLPPAAPQGYQEFLEPLRERVRLEVAELLDGGAP